MANTDVKYLLVDDLEGNLLALEGVLRAPGAELLKARSGPEALELLLLQDVALAIIDVQMPGMDGFELAELMRGTERTRLVPIIFLTAGAIDTQRRFRGYEAGAVDFLFKPLEPDILKSKAEVFLDLYRQRQEVARQRDELRVVAEQNARLLEESRKTEEQVRQMRDQLARANEELERKVQHRTAKLRETVDELEHFSYTITHDMRAPLRAMEAFGKILLDEHAQGLTEFGQDLLGRIVNSAKRMDGLITDALNYSKLVKDSIPLERIDLDSLLRGILRSYPEFQSPRAYVQIQGTLPGVLGNAAALTQCFSNLLGNAVKFVYPGQIPEVRIRSDTPADRGSVPANNGKVKIWVEDNGIGIPPDQYQRIFLMFQKLDKSKEGTGIGLALVRKVVDRMKGRVGVESEVGRGSRFWVELQEASTSDPIIGRE